MLRCAQGIPSRLQASHGSPQVLVASCHRQAGEALPGRRRVTVSLAMLPLALARPQPLARCLVSLAPQVPRHPLVDSSKTRPRRKRRTTCLLSPPLRRSCGGFPWSALLSQNV